MRHHKANEADAACNRRACADRERHAECGKTQCRGDRNAEACGRCFAKSQRVQPAAECEQDEAPCGDRWSSEHEVGQRAVFEAAHEPEGDFGEREWIGCERQCQCQQC